MNKKQLLILVGAVLVLMGITAVLVKKKDKSWQSLSAKGEKLLPASFDVNQIAAIEIKNSDKSLSLRKRDGAWKVENTFGYPADFAKISALLLKLHDLKIAQEIRAGKSQLGRLGLLNPDKKAKDKKSCATLLTMKNNKKKTLASIMVGKKHSHKSDDSNSYFNGPMQDGRYVMLAKTDKPLLVSDTLNDINPVAVDWLDKSFLKINKIKSIKRVGKDEKIIWELTREKASNTLKLSGVGKNKEEDTSKSSAIKSAFTYMYFKDVYSASEKLPEDKLKKSATVKVDTFDGFSYLIQIGMNNDGKTLAHFTISAKLAEKRIPEKDEKKEDKEKLDKQFAEKLKKLKKKLSDEQQYSKWCYVFPENKFKSIFSPRKDLVKAKKQDKKSEKKK